jgi:hypothetical protein
MNLLNGKKSTSQLARLTRSAGVLPVKPQRDMEIDTKAITDLCQKQVNHWHSENKLSNNEIAAVKQIAKSAIINRCKGNLSFVNALHKGTTIHKSNNVEKCFDPDMLYRTAQTMFRSRPDLATLREREKVTSEVFMMNVKLQRRLFYAGLLAGHIPSALCLWWSLSYNLPEGKAEREMILRCLDDDKAVILGKKINTLVKAVKADAAGDIVGARTNFDALDELNIGEFETLWKLRVEYLFAVNEEKALSIIIAGRRWFPATDILQMLTKFSEYTKNERMKTRLKVYRLSYFPTNEAFRDVAKTYDVMGEKMMAREYYEIAGLAGDKDSQKWMVEFLENMERTAWMRNSGYGKSIDTWRGMLGGAPKKEESM